MRPSPWVDRISYRWVFAVRQAALVNETSTVASRAAASLLMPPSFRFVDAIGQAALRAG
ncbi:hypothetical protein FMUAM8_34960 [Nocardia cyriacigeorgica]|nr:hypothetical protein FMUAM8_34960 [Nocardia cyriacigeorgica]